MIFSAQVMVMEHRPFPCSRCGKPYKSKKAMNTHLRFSCENKRQFFCSVCPAAYFYSHHLKRHMQHQHSNIVAGYAGSALPVQVRKLSKPSHFLELEIRRRVSCDQCGKCFKNYNSLRAHTSLDCLKTHCFSCLKCEFKTKRKFNLKMHYASRHGISLE
ncbi:hypothetical protein HUJ05_009054 [Dendroctonus ponderosae]|nr:hypothetical protein HUJ05_009054 [Dendroctonus ponderosae]